MFDLFEKRRLTVRSLEHAHMPQHTHIQSLWAHTHMYIFKHTYACTYKHTCSDNAVTNALTCIQRFESSFFQQTSIEYPWNAVHNWDQQSASGKDVKVCAYLCIPRSVLTLAQTIVARVLEQKLLDACFAWFLNQFGVPKNMWINLARSIDQEYVCECTQ